MKEVTESLVLYVISHIDYCNSVLYGLPDYEIKKMHRVQNISSKLVLGLSKYESVTNALITLHWLPVHARIEFKIHVCVLVHNIVLGQPYNI